jgi:biopolymer transport protein ExbD
MLHWETSAMAFSTNRNSGGDGLSFEINVTPLIDVLLVMLIIFMVIVPVMPRGLNSALPSAAASGVAESTEHPILVQVEQGQTGVRYLVDGVGMERAEVGRDCWNFCREDPFGRCLSRQTRNLTSA